MTKINDIFYLEYCNHYNKLLFKGVVKRIHKNVVEVIDAEDGLWRNRKSFLFRLGESMDGVKIVMLNKEDYPEHFI
jgi:hypothetical protein